MERSLFLLVILLAGQSSSLQSTSLQRFLQVPSSREVRRGESLTLACLVAHLGGECRWEREGRPIGMFRNKYEWAGDRGQGDCSLLVRDADTEWDDGNWQCSVSPSKFKAS